MIVYATRPGGAELNSLPWKPYVYQGTGVDTLTPELDDEPMWPCGTITGFTRHKYNREPQCEPCKEAQNRHRRELYREKRQQEAMSAARRRLAEATARARAEGWPA